MTETAPENTMLAAAVEAYAKPDAAEWLAFMVEHAADITPMYQQIDVNDGKDDGADARASQRKRKRAAALTDETAPLEGLKASITPPLIDVLRIVQQANLVRTGARPSQAHNGVNVAIVNEIHYAHMCMVHNMQDMPNSGILLNSYVNPRDEEDGYDGRIDQSALRYCPEDRMRLHNAPATGQLF
ncbi:hypothetical protein CYMTET_2584 [Cymbomonas tetramitiformis]|uniref:Uncharacterized protein n=1 Tax=Cymbomonas tetramitiformis TaxID=36881 RepID=A0AAE0LLM6_9CHLO|nr:hypothetical protein CYMTET_2584 [Cymbomonas tetramitiformis]